MFSIIGCRSKDQWPIDFFDTGLENVPSQWCHVRGRKRSLEVEKVTKIVLDNLDVSIAMTTTDTEASGALKDEKKLSLALRINVALKLKSEAICYSHIQ